MSDIHPTAIVHAKAKIAKGAKIGPFSVVEEGAEIGEGTVLLQGVFVARGARIGRDNRIHMGAVLGHEAQHRSAVPDSGPAVIGNNNIIREYATVHRSFQKGGQTTVGDGNFFMAHSHVGHDCTVGNGVTLVNGALLGGHAVVEDGAFVSGNAAVHQFCRIGRYAMVGGCGTATRDVPPYMLIDDNGDRVASINLVAMKRAKFSAEALSEIKKAYRILYFSGLTNRAAADEIERVCRAPEALRLVPFIRETRRGILPHRRQRQSEAEHCVREEEG